MRIDDVEKVLDAIEVAEYPMLAWGIANASMTDAELRDLISKVIPRGDVDDLKAQLLSRGLIFETPSGTYRSRIAELLRLTLTLRQWTSGNSSDASLLVHDIKFMMKQRSFPIRNLNPQNVIDILIAKKVKLDVETFRASLPQFVSEFQLRSIEFILKALTGRKEQSKEQSVVISAGTGSGKTNAFFIPVTHWLAGEMEKGHVGTRVLALYPRKELLKDQLMNALLEVRKINVLLKEKSIPTIRIGVWFGDTPTKLTGEYFKTDLKQKRWKPTKFLGQDAWSCPFLRCPTCVAQPNLVLSEDQLTKAKIQLRCSSDGCGFYIDSDELVFTREALGTKKSSCDILFSTTESANRQLATQYGECFGFSPKSNLQTILVDEAHLYEGLVGAQVAYLFRRIRNRVIHPLIWVSLSATLENASEFIKDLIGVQTEVISPLTSELEFRGSEYSIAVRHYSEAKRAPLSTGIQLAMLLSRMLDPQDMTNKSLGLFGKKIFVFCDKHDLVYRFYYFLADAEGFNVPNGINHPKIPSSLATLRSRDQLGLPRERVEGHLGRYESGQWWKASEELGHPFKAASSKKIGITSSREPGVTMNSDVVVATASLEVGFDDETVGAVIQYKMPNSAASLLQRKGRAGRTQIMRPVSAIVLAPFGRDRSAWTNAENSLFAPRVDAKRLPLSNRYSQKMSATYALLDWIYSEGGSPNSWNLLSGKYHKPYNIKNSVTKLSVLISNLNSQEEFTKYIERALKIEDQNVLREILWSQPRGLLSVVVPLALRRLETGFNEDAENQEDPLTEVISGKLFEGLDLPEVSVNIPLLPTKKDGDESESLRVQSALNEFMPGNISRAFSGKYWIPLPPVGNNVDVGVFYSAVNTGLTVQVDSGVLPLYRPIAINLEKPPKHLTEGTTATADWQTVFKTLGSPKEINTDLTIFGNQRIVIEAYLHSSGTNVLATRFVSHSRGWTSQQSGDPERINVDLVVGQQRVGLGFETNVDGLRISLKRPTQRLHYSILERSNRLLYLLQRDVYLTSVTNIFELSGIYQSLILMMLENNGINNVLQLDDSEFKRILLETSTTVSLDSKFSSHDENLKWLDQKSIDVIKSHLDEVSKDRNEDWNHWFDKRVFASLGTLLLDVFRTMVPDLDSDDLLLDVMDIVGDEETMDIWITESSPGGSGSISRIVEELEASHDLNVLLLDLLKPREFERLDLDLRTLIDFSLTKGLKIATEVRSSWSRGLKATQISTKNFESEIEKNLFYPSRSARTVFFNRFLGPGSEAELLKLGLRLCTKWDNDEKKIGFEIPSEVLGSQYKDDSTIDDALKLDNPSVGKRSAAITRFAWTRQSQGIELDYETSSYFDRSMTIDIEALRVMGLIKSSKINLSGTLNHDNQNYEVQPTPSIDDELNFKGSPVEMKAKIIETILKPIADDAIWVYPRAQSITVMDNQIILIFTTDFGGL